MDSAALNAYEGAIGLAEAKSRDVQREAGQERESRGGGVGGCEQMRAEKRASGRVSSMAVRRCEGQPWRPNLEGLPKHLHVCGHTAETQRHECKDKASNENAWNLESKE